MPSHSPWRPAVNGAGKRPWFLYRDDPVIMKRYLWAEDGKLIRYGSHESAKREADKLNTLWEGVILYDDD